MEDFLPLRSVQIFPIAGGTPIPRDFAALVRDKIVAFYQIAAPPMPAPLAATEPEEPVPAPQG